MKNTFSKSCLYLVGLLTTLRCTYIIARPSYSSYYSGLPQNTRYNFSTSSFPTVSTRTSNTISSSSESNFIQNTHPIVTSNGISNSYNTISVSNQLSRPTVITNNNHSNIISSAYPSTSFPSYNTNSFNFANLNPDNFVQTNNLPLGYGAGSSVNSQAAATIFPTSSSISTNSGRISTNYPLTSISSDSNFNNGQSSLSAIVSADANAITNIPTYSTDNNYNPSVNLSTINQISLNTSITDSSGDNDINLATENTDETYPDSPYHNYAYHQDPFSSAYSTHSYYENYGTEFTNRYYHEEKIPARSPYLGAQQRREELKTINNTNDEKTVGIIASQPKAEGIIRAGQMWNPTY